MGVDLARRTFRETPTGQPALGPEALDGFEGEFVQAGAACGT